MSWVAAAGMGLEVLGSVLGASAEQKVRRLQKQSARAETTARLQDLTTDYLKMRGQQRTQYAAANVFANVGSARVLGAEAQSQYARSQALEAYLGKAREKGIQTEGRLSGIQTGRDITSSITNFANSMYNRRNPPGGGKTGP